MTNEATALADALEGHEHLSRPDRLKVAALLRASPQPSDVRTIEVDIGAALAALQESPELAEAMNAMVGGPALVEAQNEIERLNAEIARLSIPPPAPAVTGDVREALIATRPFVEAQANAEDGLDYDVDTPCAANTLKQIDAALSSVPGDQAGGGE